MILAGMPDNRAMPDSCASQAWMFYAGGGRLPKMIPCEFGRILTGSLISLKQNVKDIVIPSEEESLDMFRRKFSSKLSNSYILYQTIKKMPIDHKKALTLKLLYTLDSLYKGGD